MGSNHNKPRNFSINRNQIWLLSNNPRSSSSSSSSNHGNSLRLTTLPNQPQVRSSPSPRVEATVWSKMHRLPALNHNSSNSQIPNLIIPKIPQLPNDLVP